MTIAFDVDETLVRSDEALRQDVPNYDVIELLHWFDRHGFRVIVWSRRGQDYARRAGDRLGLPSRIEYMAKGDLIPDIAVDDQDLLGKVNIII